MPRHIRTIIQVACNTGGREGSSCGRGEKGGQIQIYLPSTHWFSPLAIETMGAMGPKSMALLREVGRRVATESGEPRSTDYLLQRLSVAVQRGNCASVLGSIAT